MGRRRERGREKRKSVYTAEIPLKVKKKKKKNFSWASTYLWWRRLVLMKMDLGKRKGEAGEERINQNRVNVM